MPRDPHPDRTDLLKTWQAIFGSPAPAYLSVVFLQKAIAHERQCKAKGGLSAASVRALRQIAQGRDIAKAIPLRLSPGSQLVRDWNGRRYQVDVTEEGFRMDGRNWASLSAIAKHITGTAWSGPRFFGLTRADPQ